jgi:tRNA (guanine-N7-)-methyltransferase
VPAGEVIDLPRGRHVLFSLVEPTSLVDRLDLEKAFGRRAPLHVDLGCGDGSFLRALAPKMPEKNFLGIERLLGRSNSAARKANNIGNVRILRMESFYAVRYLLPPASVETFYLLFPDPWPKRRHQRRRIVTEDFLGAISDALAPNGTLRIATDQLDYFEQMKQIAGANAALAGFEKDDADIPPTKFEKTFQAQGAAIYRAELRKISPVR